MDITGLLAFLLAAIVTATWIMIVAAFGREPGFRGPFVLSYALAILLNQPWNLDSWQEAGLALVMLILSAIVIAGGCVVGGIPAVLIVAVVRRVARGLR